MLPFLEAIASPTVHYHNPKYFMSIPILPFHVWLPDSEMLLIYFCTLLISIMRCSIYPIGYYGVTLASGAISLFSVLLLGGLLYFIYHFVYISWILHVFTVGACVALAFSYKNMTKRINLGTWIPGRNPGTAPHKNHGTTTTFAYETADR